MIQTQFSCDSSFKKERRYKETMRNREKEGKIEKGRRERRRKRAKI
jgi:hypothetical protein